MTRPTTRQRQQATAKALTDLLTRDLPVAYWVIFHTDGRAHGLVGSADEVRAWAQVISDGAVDVRRFEDGQGEVRACGAGQYTAVEIWFPLTSEELAGLPQAEDECLTAAGA